MAKFKTQNGHVRIWGKKLYEPDSNIRIDLLTADSDLLEQLEELTKLGYLKPVSFEDAEKEKFEKEFKEFYKMGEAYIKAKKEENLKYIESLKKTGDPKIDNKKITIEKLEALKGGM